MSKPIVIALSKGRILKDTMPLLEQAGLALTEDPSSSRSLRFPTQTPGVEALVVRAADVPTFVEHGAADLGVTGKDVLLEHGGQGLYEPLDLGIARCRLMLAKKADAPDLLGSGKTGTRLRVATKYIETTKQYFARRGQQVELIKLYGSMELAPLTGMADYIVDLVDTGNTLRANGLVATETIVDVSSRLVVNRASMKTRRAEVAKCVDGIAAALTEKAA